MKFFRYQIILAVLVLSAVILSACSTSSNKNSMKLAPLSEMPDSVKISPETVRESYQFAKANPDILKNIPCYCGCGPMGHTSNYSCYIQSADNSEIVYDEHALGCSICVDITSDTMHMLTEGKSVKEIRGLIDQRYSPFGPSNMEPLAE